MIILAIIGEKLFIGKGDHTFYEPLKLDMSMTTGVIAFLGMNNEVKISGVLSDFVDGSMNPFPNEGALLTYVGPYLGFKTASGGSGAPRKTESEINLIADPYEGMEVFNTTRGTKMFYHTFFGWTPDSIPANPWWGYSFYDEKIAPNNGHWATSLANGGAFIATTFPALSPTRLCGFATGTTANGDAQSRTADYFLGSVGKKRTESKVSVSDLSKSDERYVCFSGYIDSPNALDQNNAMYFLYDEGGMTTGSTASPNWQCVCASGGTRTFVTTSVPVTDTSSGAMQKLRIDDDGTGKNVRFYIDEILVATITINIPPSTVGLYNLVRITKQAGTTQRALYVDYTQMQEKFKLQR